MRNEKPLPRLVKMRLPEFKDVTLYGSNLYDLFESCIRDDGVSPLEFKSPNGNRVVYDGGKDLNSMKSTTVYFGGRNNTIHLNSLDKVHRLGIACIGGSSVTMEMPITVRGATIMASAGANISIKSKCMISRDVIFYASGAHGLYNLKDGMRRGNPNIAIGEHVWIGQGARVLAGAKVGPGSVIGSYSVLAGKIPNNCAAAGNPCRVTSRDIFWSAETISGNYYEYLEKKGKTIENYIKNTDEG